MAVFLQRVSCESWREAVVETRQKASCNTWWDKWYLSACLYQLCRQDVVEATSRHSGNKRYLPAFFHIIYAKKKQSSKSPEDIVGQTIRDRLLTHLSHGNKHSSKNPLTKRTLEEHRGTKWYLMLNMMYFPREPTFRDRRV